jgi:hypothetical protein
MMLSVAAGSGRACRPPLWGALPLEPDFDDREVDLGLVGVEIEEGLIDLVHHLRDPRVRSIDPHHQQSFLPAARVRRSRSCIGFKG